jgi:SAM-dependent methyltransferase
MAEINLLAKYPRAKRNLVARKLGQAENRIIARQFGRDYFDGTREQGYGGYRYDGRWLPIARDMAAHFGLKRGDRVLDIGCAKGFLMRDLMEVVPGLEVWGLEISYYAIENCHPDMRGRIARGTAQKLPFASGSFAAALCINVVHNLPYDACVEAVQEIERVAPGRGYIQVDAYRNDDERDAFLDWVLTAETFGKPDMWYQLFERAGYTGDYYWTGRSRVDGAEPRARPKISSGVRTMKKTYAVLGGGGSFGLHTSKYLLDHADPAKVIAVGRNLPKYDCFTLGIGEGDPRYSYHAYHVNYELDLLMELLDREKPQVIVNGPRGGRDLAEAFMALLRDQLRGARQAGRGAAIARLSRAVHSYRNLGALRIRRARRRRG